ncbi:MAG: hypothetical protein MUE81_11950 [Thermoflexibacter sp.]|jgi:hypothetical protein|nr:hypothetical protein [Thermoflexibacter sp.]
MLKLAITTLLVIIHFSCLSQELTVQVHVTMEDHQGSFEGDLSAEIESVINNCIRSIDIVVVERKNDADFEKIIKEEEERLKKRGLSIEAIKQELTKFKSALILISVVIRKNDRGNYRIYLSTDNIATTEKILDFNKRIPKERQEDTKFLEKELCPEIKSSLSKYKEKNSQTSIIKLPPIEPPNKPNITEYPDKEKYEKHSILFKTVSLTGYYSKEEEILLLKFVEKNIAGIRIYLNDKYFNSAPIKNQEGEISTKDSELFKELNSKTKIKIILLDKNSNPIDIIYPEITNLLK